MFSIEATPEAKGLWANARLHPESVREYVRYYREIDPWTQATFARRLIVPGAVYTGDMLIPTERLRETEYYRDFLLRFDNVDLLCAMLHDGSQPPVPTIALSVYRGIGDPPFAAGDIARMQPLIPHLQLATAVSFQLTDRDRRLAVQGHALDAARPTAAAVEPGRRGGADQLRGGGPARRGRRADSQVRPAAGGRPWQPAPAGGADRGRRCRARGRRAHPAPERQATVAAAVLAWIGLAGRAMPSTCLSCRKGPRAAAPNARTAYTKQAMHVPTRRDENRARRRAGGLTGRDGLEYHGVLGTAGNFEDNMPDVWTLRSSAAHSTADPGRRSTSACTGS